MPFAHEFMIFVPSIEAFVPDFTIKFWELILLLLFKVLKNDKCINLLFFGGLISRSVGTSSSTFL